MDYVIPVVLVIVPHCLEAISIPLDIVPVLVFSGDPTALHEYKAEGTEGNEYNRPEDANVYLGT
jgi:hypothetical protein